MTRPVRTGRPKLRPSLALRKATLVLPALLMAAGCATDRPLAFTCPRFEEFLIPVRTGPVDQVAAAGKSLSPLESLVASTFPSGTQADGTGQPARFLILSGGGQWGAFGAGFLEGWSKHGTGSAARPDRFDMVTGVSTGALQATFAFLGKAYDGALLEAYTITNESQLLKRHGPFFFLAHGSMADTAPLNTYVRDKLRPLLDQVAAPEHAGRKLLVGVVDGLDGHMYAVDLTRIATERSGTEREDCYAAALLASASVPVVFRQTTINGRPYLDGGVRHSVFVADVQEAVAAAGAVGNRPATIHVLMNGDIRPKSVASLPPKLLPTLNRLRTIVFNQIELSSIVGVAERYPGMTTYVATAAGHSCDALADEESEVFQPRTMRCLREYGQERWTKSPVPWTVYQHRVPQP